MSIHRVFTLLKKEFLYGSHNFIFVMAVVMPVGISLILSLLLGTLFSEKPRLGILDRGTSQLTALILEQDFILTETYTAEDTLRADVERGALDIALILPENFDRQLQADEVTRVDLFVWGESLLKHRTVLAVAVTRGIMDVAGREIPIETELVLLGEEANIPWDVRLFPLLVVITIFIGGMMVPATSLVEEKMRRTYRALLTTPATLADILGAKGLTGVILALFNGLLILFINNAFGAQPALLVGLLALGGIFAAAMGIIFGTLVKDVNTLFALIKGTGLILYAPAFIFIFPEIPQWIAKLFPTYYVLAPIVNLTMNNATWNEIAVDVYILIALIVALLAVAGFLARRALDSDA